ncbi:hypothetical protein VCR12J2_1010148 [Vibrio coralliirubri]|uniref:heparinase II/III family protein n=1 Tax=Vibrio coralliirubri TaxID=1516159 RepID=UPI0006344658|nr:heparinase II/III family protein [Vibrio coralliirubri]CDT77921.1 hypothetical protein VCR12J2_1010148 [Vibrio coralliirubri]
MPKKLTMWRASIKEAQFELFKDLGVKVTFSLNQSPKSGVFVVRELDNDSLPVLVNFDMRLECTSKDVEWVSVDVGYYIGDKFYFLTFKHERFDTLLNVNLDPASIQFLIANKYKVPLSWLNAKVRIRIRLIGNGDATLTLTGFNQRQEGIRYSILSTIDDYDYFSFSRKSLLKNREKREFNASNIYILDSYWTKHNDIEENAAKVFIEEGKVHYSKLPIINIDSTYPPSQVVKLPNYERRWYSLELVHILVSEWRKDNTNLEVLMAAMLAAERFISHDFYGEPDNIKYIWYDHGTADRLVVLSELYCCLFNSVGDKFTLERLFYVIYRHAQALACESFYLRNQRVKYHNHAIFQDRALIVIAETFPSVEIFQVWKDTAIERCAKQFDNLITTEGASVENSSGYHVAMKEIVHDMVDFYSSIKLFEHSSNLKALEDKMKLFSEALYYPDDSIPAFGDTTFKLNRKRNNLSKYFLEEVVSDFKDSGYLFISGMTQSGVAFKFNLISSSQSLIHKHFDNLSFTLWVNGIEFIVDPGFFSHALDPISIFSKGPYSHNTSIPLGFDSEADWRESISQSVFKVYKSPGSSKYKIVGHHYCYSGKLFTRCIFIDINKGYILCNDHYEYDLPLLNNLQFGDSLSVSRTENGVFDISSYCGKESIQVVFGEGVTTESVIGQEKPTMSGWIFPKVGVKEPAYALNSKSRSNELLYAISIGYLNEFEITDIVDWFSNDCWLLI